jgi:acetylornithine deacetylase/succinyl-diaminopimelate desuccinylase-like protein
MSEGCELLIRLLRDAGFDSALRVPTDGQPGVFATLDAGAKRTVGIYFMYDVKQVDPAEWSSPPWDAAFVDKPGFGKAIVGRGAVNQKGPEAALLAALHAFRGAGRKLPVNLVLIAEGEEEIGSPNFAQIVRRPEVQSALARTTGVFMPSASQSGDGVVLVTLGAKGIVELELTSTGERWGRGPRQDIHSSNKARVDSPAWHLVHALHTLVTPEGEPAIDGFADRARPISAAEKAMVAEGARRFDEAVLKKQMGVQRWIKDVGFLESLERLVSQPTVNIEGLVGGYTGPGGKTILPHKAVAKLDLRLVPDMKASEALAALKSQLAKRGFGDVEARMTGGYDPTSTAADAALIRAQIGVYRRAGIEPVVWPRNAGSWPGYVFTGEPLLLPAGHFGLGHGGGAHAPDEYYVIESTNPKVQGFDGAVRSFVEYLQELAVVS